MSQAYNQEEDFQQAKRLDFSLWKKLWKYMVSKNIHLMRKSLFYISVVAVVDIIYPVLIQYAIDTFIIAKQLDYLVFFIIGSFVIFALQAYYVYGFISASGKFEAAMNTTIRHQGFEKLQNHSFAYYDTTASGWIVARMTSDISRLSEMFAWLFIDSAWGLVVGFGILFVMLFVNWQLFLVMMALVPVIYFISLFFQKRMLANWRDVRKINSQLTAKFSEGIMGAKTTKVMAIENFHIHDFQQESNYMRKRSIAAATLSSIYGPIIQLVISLMAAVVLVMSGIEVINNTISVGTLMMFVNYTTMFFNPIRNFSGIFSEIQMAQASAERVISLLEKPVTILDSPAVIEKYGTILNPKLEAYEPMVGDIEFKQVNFHYIENEPVLSDFNLTIHAGQTIALVGETGSGKSTISNLICRFYEPTSGQILIDGIDYKERSIGWLHANLGVVLQTPHLFSGTIADNIRFAKKDLSMDAVIQAAKNVNAHEFIEQLEKGYESEVGQGGNKLSTGQKQLICFARALVHNPKLVVLDEASASIDSATEYEINQAISKLLKDRTSIVVAHRLSTIVNADKILVIEKGKIIEAGNHQTLIASKGHYYQLYTNQFNQERQQQLMKNVV